MFVIIFAKLIQLDKIVSQINTNNFFLFLKSLLKIINFKQNNI